MPSPIDKILRNRHLETLVENQTSYTLQNTEIHLFETHQNAESVYLRFDQPVLASMLQGKKVMHLNKLASFDFLPGESVMLPRNELMCIDFPEACLQDPTRCLAMAIAEEKIRETVQLLNETQTRTDDEWKITDANFHFSNDIAIQQIIDRLVFLCAEDHPSKDLFAQNMLRELIIRILQADSQHTYLTKSHLLCQTHRLAYIIEYIRQNLSQDISVKKLSDMVHMSESHFYRVFKNELNLSPVDFINQERIKLAKRLLKDPKRRIKDVYMECGFNSLSYFIRIFKRKVRLSPKEYQVQAQRSNLLQS
ncbi:MAG: AraC family transcriptional regulator [Bacteroidota bacterium]